MVTDKFYNYINYKYNSLTGIIKSHWSRKISVDNIIFLIAIPRSGSTLLLDTLRSHPQITYSNRSTIFDEFNISGYRYPLDLVIDTGNKYGFENKFGRWVKIPSFKIPFDFIGSDQLKNHTHYYIEKIHPEFFNYDYIKFISHIKRFTNNGRSVKVIYILREPKSVVSSWLSYKTRNPQWNFNKKNSEVVEYYLKNFNSMSEMSSQFPGPIIDFSNLINDLEPTLQSLYQYLWQKQKTEIDINIINSSINLTDRDKRQSNNTKFLGKNIGKTKGSLPEHENLLFLNKEKLAECVSIYNDLAWD